MPSQNIISLPGANKIISGSGFKDLGTNAIAKGAGGSNAEFHGISLPRDSNFKGEADTNINKELAIGGTTPVGSTIHTAKASTSGVGVASQFRKLSEVTLPDPMPFRGGINSKVADSEPIVGSVAAGGAWHERIDGRWENSSGVLGTPLGSGYSYTQQISGSGDTTTLGRGHGQSYTYRIGLTETVKHLNSRNQ